MSRDLVIAVDQGTGSTKTLLLDSNLEVVRSHAVPIALYTESGGIVQQDPLEILDSVIAAIDQVSAGFEDRIIGLAITNQRESALAFSAAGEPLSRVLSWQDRSTAELAQAAPESMQSRVREITGLPLDPMFSALKFQSILDALDPDRTKSSDGEILLGTIDAWLLFRLTGQHLIEIGNSHRTQLVDIRTGTWSDELLGAFKIPRESLPQIVPSLFESCVLRASLLKGLPVLAVLADSHAALFSRDENLKVTFGTGSSLMALAENVRQNSGLVATIAWGSQSSVTRAYEGNTLSSGATLTWLSRLFNLSVTELAELASSRDTDLMLVPAFGGLGAPWWDSDAKALAVGMTLDTEVADFARAGFEAMVFQALDLIDDLEQVTGTQVKSLSVDGGPTGNAWFCQLLANLTQREITPALTQESSAIGVAKFAAEGHGLFPELKVAVGEVYIPKISKQKATNQKQRWREALRLARGGDKNDIKG